MKLSGTARLLAGTALGAVPALMVLSSGNEATALPKNGAVTAGEATISTPDAKSLQIDQASTRAVIDWQSFDIAADEKVIIVQQADQSSLLNRIIGGGGASQILGELVAGGRVILVNPAGFDFAATARVDVGSLIASTASIGTQAFMDGRLDFDQAGDPDARIVNAGELTAAEGGLIALVAPGVANAGRITARLGKIALASGTRFTLDLYGDELVRIAIDGAVLQEVLGVDGEALDALIANSGELEADGGLIQISAAAADGAVDSLINLGGHVRAQSVAEVDGEILLQGRGAGTVLASAQIDVSGDGAGERGGRVRILGEKVALHGGGTIDATGAAGGGTVLLGGNYQGQGPEANARRSFVGAGTAIDVSATQAGDAGTAIVWADEITRFHGSIRADGGATGGDGGLVEVSGKQDLIYRGSVTTAAPMGNLGRLLLDPDDIVIANGSGGADDAEVTGDGTINFLDGGNVTFTISEQALEGLAAGTNITLQANNSITINDLSDDTLSLNQTGSVTFEMGAGGFSMTTADTIAMTGTGGDLVITATGGGDLSLGNVTLNGGDVTLTGDIIGVVGISGGSVLTVTADANFNVNGAVSTNGSVTIDADSGNDGTGSFNIDSSGSLISNGNDIAITAAGVTLDGNLNAGSADITITTSQTAGTIGLGGAAGVTIAIDNTELDRITADDLILGATSGNTNAGIDVQGVTAGATDQIGGSLVLYAYSPEATVTFSSTDTSITPSIVAEGEGNVSVSVNLSSTAGTMSFRADADADGLGDFTIPTASDSLTTTNKNITIQADDVTLDGAVSAGSGDVTFLTSRTSDTVGLGGAAGTLSLTNSEIDKISAANLVIGALSGNVNAGILVDGLTDATSDGISSGITLIATGSEADVTFQTTSSVVNPGIELKAADRVHLNGVDLTSTSGSIDFTADANAGGDSNNDVLFTGNRTITAGNTITLNASGGISGTGTLDLKAASGVTIINNLANASGQLLIESDTNSNGTGTLTIPDGVQVSATGQNLKIIAADIDLGGSSGTRLSANTIVIQNSNNAGINIGTTSGSGLVLSDTELARISASNSTSFFGDATNPSAIIVDSVSDADGENLGNVSFDTTTSVTFNGNSQFDRIIVEADDGIAVNGNLTADTSFIELDGDDNFAPDGTDSITFAAGVTLDAQGGNLTIRAQNGEMTAAGALTLRAIGLLNVNDSLTLGGPLVALADTDGNGLGSFALITGETINSQNNDITISGNTAGITGTLNAGTGTVTLLTSTTDRPVALGANTAGTFALDASEIANIMAGNLVVGATSGQTNDTITVTGVSAANTANIGAVTLNAYSSEADVIFATTASTFTNAITVNAADQIAFNVNLTTNAGDITLTADANAGGDANNNIAFNGVTILTAGSSLSLAASGGITGSSITNLIAGTGVTVNSNFTNTSGLLAIDADSDDNGTGIFTVPDNVLVDASGQTLNIAAADIALGGSSGTRLHGATVAIRSSDNSGINLGTAGSSINLSGTELERILALTTNFGDGSDNVVITVGAISDAEAENLGTVNIDTAASVTFSGASTFDALSVNADDGITVNADIVTDIGFLSLDADDDDSPDTSDRLTIAGGVTLDSVGVITLFTATGGFVTTGTVALSSADDIVIQDDLSLGGSLSIEADDDASGGGNFFLNFGGSINANNNDVSIVANDFNITGGTAFNVGTGTLSISVSDAGTIGLGSALNMTIDAAELAKITAGTLIVGTIDDPAGAITMAGLDTANELANITNLAVRSQNASLTVTGTTSVTGALTLEANTGVTISGDVTTGGTVSINGDIDANGTGGFTLNAATLASGNANITITGSNYNTSSPAVINAGTGTLTFLTSTTSQTFGIGTNTDFGISGDEFAGFTAANTVFGATSGATAAAINVDGITAANSDNAGTVTLNAFASQADITFSGTASTFDALNVNAGDSISISANVTTDTGNLSLSANGAGGGTDHIVFSGGPRALDAQTDLSLATPNGRSTASDDLSLTADNDISIQNSIAATSTLLVGADDDSDGAGTVTIAGGAALVSNAVETPSLLGGADLILAGTFSGSLISVASTNSAQMSIGAGGGGFVLDNAELSRLSASTGTLFFEFAGAPVSISGVDAVSSAALADVVLVAAGSVSVEGAASSFQGIQINANNGLAIEADLAAIAADGDIILDGDANNSADGNDGLDFADGVTLSAGGEIDLLSLTGGIQADGIFTASAGDGLKIHDSFTAEGEINLSAGGDQESENAFTIEDGATLTSNGNAINIAAGDLDLQSTGAINAGSGNLSLRANASSATIGLGGRTGTFEISDTELSRLTAGNLLIGGSAAGETNGTVTIDGIGAAETAGIAGAITINALADGADILFAGSPSTLPAGAFNAENNVAITVDLTVNGPLILSADADGDGSGGVSVNTGVTASSGNNALTVSSNGLTIDGTLDAGSGLFTFVDPTGNLVFGDGGVDNEDFDSIQFGALVLGSTTTNSVSIDGALAAETTNDTEQVTIVANGTSGTVSFINGASIFPQLTVSAADIVIGTDISTTIGPLVLNGSLVLGADSTIASNDNTLTVSGRIDGDHDLILNAGAGAVQVGSDIGLLDPLASLTITASSIELEDVETTGGQLYAGAAALLGAYTSASGDIAFAGNVTLDGATTITSGGGAVAFDATIEGPGVALDVNSGGGNVAFDGDVGANGRLGPITITDPNNVSVGGTLRTGDFSVDNASGEVDLGFNSLDADGNVDIQADTIEGKITAKAVFLRATGAGIGVKQALQIFADSLDFNAASLVIEGLIGGSVEATLEAISAVFTGGGPFTFNSQDVETLVTEFTIEEDIAIEIAANQIENIVEEQDEVIEAEEEEQIAEDDDDLEILLEEEIGTAEDPLLDIVGNDEVADIEDEEEEEGEGGCGCG